MHPTPSGEDVRSLAVALFDAAADAIVVVDEGGRVALANRACERLLGYEVDQLLGRQVETLVPARYRGHGSQRASFMANPRPRAMGLGLHLTAMGAGGQEIPVDIALTPLAVGGRVWTAAALRDMRGRVQGSDALRIQATALRSAANGIVITDRTGSITWVNRAACAITGYSADELVGRHTRLLKSGQHEPGFYETLWRTVTRGETWSGTIVNRRKDGTQYHEEQTIAPVFDDAGEISHFIAIKQDVTERHRAEEALARAHDQLAARVAEIELLNRQLRELAIRDPLTGLYNRRWFEEAAAREAARAVRSGEPLSVAALDLDRFKEVNDRFGHAVGDTVLRAMAQVLGTEVRASDLVCRMGGEEFVVVLPGASLEIAWERAERWRARFAAKVVNGGNGAEVRCTVSIGLALFGGADRTIETALQRADVALYEAKRAGRDRIVSGEGELLREPG